MTRPLPSRNGSTVSGTQFGSVATPLLRQHLRLNRLAPNTTDITSFVVDANPDATLTKKYSPPISGLADQQARLLTSTEIAGLAYDPGAGRSIVFASGGVGYEYMTPIANNIDSPATWPNILQRTIRFMCDGPKVDVNLYSPLQTGMLQVYVDGLPVQSGPIDAGFLTLLHLVFPTAKPRRVEVTTDTYIGYIATGPLYKIWKAQPAPGPRMLIIGDSYTSPLVWNDAGTAAKYMNGWAQQVADYLDLDDVWIEGINSTGFVARASGQYGAPNNNYLDRVSGHTTTVKPDIVVVGSAFTNDMFGGTSVASSVANANAYCTAIRAAQPNCKLIFLNGWRAPLLGDFTASYAACITALQQLRSDVYYIDTASMMDMAGYIPGHTTGTGNSDLYIGNDGIHPTLEGHAYLRGRIAAAIQHAVQDNGSLINTMITA